MKKLALLFPGIGYTADKPLLYYSRRIAAALGYEVLPLRYSGFPKAPKDDPEKLKACFALAQAQTEEQLKALRLSDYGEIVFIAKSIGTVAAAAQAAQSAVRERIRFVLFTPLEETFRFPLGEAAAFTGGADPWVGGGESRIPALCRERDIPCLVIPGANHSLETGSPLEDLQNLMTVMRRTRDFLRTEEKEAP